jgi:hypothetical protein
VDAHSIIPVKGSRPLEKENNGVVKYKNASSTRRPWRAGMRSKRSMRALGLALLLGFGGCASNGAAGATTPVTVTDAASVAGKWAGLLTIAGGRDREDYVEVTVDPNGTYRASAARTIGLLDTQGTITASGGRLIIKGESGGQATAVLYSQPPPDHRLLVINGTASDGRAYTLRLRPQR